MFLRNLAMDYPELKVEFGDDDDGWANDDCTAVLTFNYEGPLGEERWASFMEFVHRVSPDEFDWAYLGDTAETERIYFRLWWD